MAGKKDVVHWPSVKIGAMEYRKKYGKSPDALVVGKGSMSFASWKGDNGKDGQKKKKPFMRLIKRMKIY